MAPIFYFLNCHKNIFRHFCLVILLCLQFILLNAQKKQSASFSPAIHLRHVVQPHETFSSIGKLYGVSGEEIADYNNLEYYDDDVLAKYLTIPLNNHNYTLNEKASPNHVLVPVYKANGSTERLVLFKKRNKKSPSGYSVFFSNNGLLDKFGGRPVVVGYLRTEKANSSIFKTIEPSSPVRPIATAAASNKDTVRNALAKASQNTLPNTSVKDAKLAQNDSHVIVKKVVTASNILPGSKPQIKQVIEIHQSKKIGYRPISRVDRVYVLVKTQLVIIAVLVLVIFFLMRIRNKRQLYRNQLKGSLRKLVIDEVLSDDSFNETLQKDFVLKEFLLKRFNKKSSRQFLIDEIIRGRKSLKGKAGENFLKLYLKLQLQEDSHHKLKSKSWETVAKGIQELAIMEQNLMMPEIFTEINSKNEYVRMEAQSALVHLSGFGGLWFLNVLNYPISEWQQMKLISQLSTSPVSDIPDLHLLLASPNELLVIFTLKLIGVFQQRAMHHAVLGCLNQKSEAIRYQAIKCLTEINTQYTSNALVRKFASETRKNKIAIVDAIGEIGDDDHSSFLLQVLSIKDDTLKTAAAKALNKMGGNSIQLLEEYCANHGDPYTQILLHIKSANAYDLV